MKELLDTRRPFEVERSSKHDELYVVHHDLQENTGLILDISSASESTSNHEDYHEECQGKDPYDSNYVHRVLRTKVAFEFSRTQRVSSVTISAQNSLVTFCTSALRVMVRRSHPSITS